MRRHPTCQITSHSDLSPSELLILVLSKLEIKNRYSQTRPRKITFDRISKSKEFFSLPETELEKLLLQVVREGKVRFYNGSYYIVR